ncbi:MAG TPA: hypothetical protein VLB84_09385, partial [Bacteroidia bacterium]|nr:hypothetical protein [Bacteroidia bacterium]
MKNLALIFFISLFLSPLFIKAQDTIPQSSIHSIFDIPHKTIWQKWMWIHRSVAFMIIKDRKPYFDTTYVKTYKKSVSVTVPVSSRFLRFNLVDWSSGNT